MQNYWNNGDYSILVEDKDTQEYITTRYSNSGELQYVMYGGDCFIYPDNFKALLNKKIVNVVKVDLSDEKQVVKLWELFERANIKMMPQYRWVKTTGAKAYIMELLIGEFWEEIYAATQV